MLDTTFNNEFEKQLEAAGYRWFKDYYKNSIRGFQKRFTDEKGTKYFITGYHWNLGLKYPSAPKQDQYTFNCQFTLNEDAATTDVDFSGKFIPDEYSGPVLTLKDAEDFYEKYFNVMNCDYYEEGF